MTTPESLILCLTYKIASMIMSTVRKNAFLGIVTLCTIGKEIYKRIRSVEAVESLQITEQIGRFAKYFILNQKWPLTYSLHIRAVFGLSFH